VKIEMAVSEPFVSQPSGDPLGARTGEVGDGKIFVQPLGRRDPYRSGERDVASSHRR